MAGRDADATRARILAAAQQEFAAVGHAGGRVERIARSAGTNVRMIYAYFGGKAGLFDAAVRAAVEEMAAAVPPDPAALSAWAGRLFDHHQADPTALRLSLWAHLERPEVAAEPMEAYLAKTARIGSTGREISAVDLLAIIYAIAQAWTLTPIGLLRSDGSDPSSPERIAAHRRAVLAAVAAITAEEGGATG
ncbi:TetR family transcriptional regulator [Brachybacterium phenoliresistens]|uniref:TetR family transcriptional regulator n=1 Tax=Brachybacterium phenoliresistens TaxID=396014 RepID=Z9JTW3_9MICO|nr:TetR family transcriptional regulator [Brachybacterium phenoliresistens]EWS81820.1 TetR family transcriptional regulator [Brachybacterium phenoliresistens]